MCICSLETILQKRKVGAWLPTQDLKILSLSRCVTRMRPTWPTVDERCGIRDTHNTANFGHGTAPEYALNLIITPTIKITNTRK